MRFLELSPEFIDAKGYRVETLDESAGVRFQCPKCLGTEDAHTISIYRPCPATDAWGGTRWRFSGAGLADLTFGEGKVSGSSVLLLYGCRAHFFVAGGEVVMSFDGPAAREGHTWDAAEAVWRPISS